MVYHYSVCARTPTTEPHCSADIAFRTSGAALSVSADPALYPAFEEGIKDYVTRCTGSPVALRINAPAGTAVSVDGQPGQSGSFTKNVAIVGGQRFDFTTTSGGDTSTYHVRCLPADFPDWTYSRSSSSALAFTLVTPSLSLTQAPFPYVAFFNTRGVPVWWYKASGPPVDASLLSGNLVAFSLYPGADYQLRRLDGTLVRTVGTVGTPTDFHELKPLLNGNFIVTSYKLRDGVDLSPYGGPSNATVQDAEIQEINPSGAVVWRWNSKDHIPLSETPDRWWSYILKNSVTLPDGRKAYDPVHLNAVEPDGTSLLISARHLDAIYSIDRSTGNIEWKVGGRTTSKSLAVVGDNVTPTLGGQHDVRRLSDGTVSVYDNNTDLGRPPRVLRFKIDLSKRTATIVEELKDFAPLTSACCGSARKLPSRGWLVDWGGPGGFVSEYTNEHLRISKLTFSRFTYRAVPILPGGINTDTLRAGMDAQFPRAASAR